MKRVAFVLVAACAIIIVLAALMLPLSHRRIPMNHMRAAHWTRQLITAEHQYAAKFPAIGFTCDLPQLEKAGVVDKVLASGERSGYRYELGGCSTSPTARLFTVSAVPLSAGITGKLVFCANEEGVLWYANSGSSDECLRARRNWVKADSLKD
jgi:hypothetical protein